MYITAHDPDNKKTYRLNVSPAWARRNDNGSLISTGLWLNNGDISKNQLKNLIRRGQAIEISEEKGNHSGCQSRCILRGDKFCQW